MIKPIYIYTTVLILLISAFYFSGIKPYFNALNETRSIITSAGIPFDKSTNKIFYQKTIVALQSRCQNGVMFVDTTEVRCASDAYFIAFQ